MREITKKLDFRKIYQSIIGRAFIYALLSFLFLRIFTSVILLIGIFQPSPVFSTVEITQNNIEFLEQKSEFSKLFLAPWYRWDTGHYIEIADFGYDFDSVLSVWPPLYPFLIKIVGFIFKPTIVAALFVSNIFFVIALFLLYLYVQGIYDEEIAQKTLFFAVIFPTSFYFVAGYTESIFLFFSVAVFLLIKKKKWVWAGIISALASLTRVQGILLVIPIFIELWLEYYPKKDFKAFFKHLISCTFAPFSYGLYSLYVFYGLKLNWPWVTLSSHWDQHFGWPWEGLIFTTSVLLGKQIESDITPILVKILTIVLPIGVIFLLYKIRKMIPLSLSIYCWAMLFLVMGKVDYNNGVVSTIRYLISIFPIFIGQALLFKNKYLKLSYFTISSIIQIILLVMFYWWYWVA